jgi:ABC-2 type transport system ATP-binding protein
MLTFSAIEKYYGRNLVLEIPSLQLDRGIYWLQGANGSGKTTFLRMIAGLLPFNGDIQLNGYSLRRNPVLYRRCVSWSDAEPVYPGFVTGNDLIAFYQKIRKTSAADVNRLISFFNIQHWLSTPVGTYSSGMVKKLSLVLSFIGFPPLIALDEPLTTLDAATVPLVIQLINDAHAQHDCSFLLSSHQPVEDTSLVIDKKLLVTGQTISYVA